MENKKENKIATINWLSLPEEHDYEASYSYLSLLFPEAVAEKYAIQLKKANMNQFKAKDIFRASSLSLLGISNKHVKRNLDKMKEGKNLSPILLVRDDLTHKLIIADGYHRMCAVYTQDEDALIPCKII